MTRIRPRLLIAALTSWIAAIGLAWTCDVSADEKGHREVEAHNVSDSEKVQWAKATKVSIIDAIRTAQAKSPGQAIQVTLESLDGRLLYEVEIVTGEGKVIELFVDPQTGKLVEGRR